jgi:hypothetical protein
MRKSIAMAVVLSLALTTIVGLTLVVGAEEYECPVCGSAVLYGQEECDFCGEVLEWDDVEADIDIDPDTLNLKSKGKWISCIIDPLLRNATVKDASTVKIMDINGVSTDIPASDFPVGVKDLNDDGIPELMVKFDRQVVEDACVPGPNTITITGQLTDSTIFKGSDTINVINPP